ncbi:MAG: chromosome replication initiation protein [Isosphaera sp.]|nr:chromosome replication initiation protein [Isosphaera sp.]
MAAAVSARVTPARYGLWFQGHARFVPLGAEVVVAARTPHTRDWLEHTFGPAVREAVAEVCGPGTAVRWAVDAETVVSGQESAVSEDKEVEQPRLAATRSGARHPAEAPTPDSRPPAPVDLFGDPVAPPKPRPKRPEPEVVVARAGSAGKPARRWKLLSEFVVGPCNRVAHASALSVVEEPGDAANPLVLHGPVGVGKTHLLEGICAGLRRRPDQRPVYATAEEFTTKFVAASQHGKMGAFRRQFRECSALLLDDLHFLATKKATQAEFLHTFDALVADGRQVVVTTDCHPRLADELMPELVDRLLGGAVWGLLPPDPETRLEILRKKATGANPPVPDGVLKGLAASLRGNVRELEGAVNTVRHYAKVTGRPVDAAGAREALGDLLRHAVRVVSVADVDAAVCAVLRLASGTLQSKSRAWAVTHPRMLAVYLCRKHTAATYGEIAKHFGAKTHSTAVAAEKKVRGWLDKDAGVAIGDRDWKAKELVDRVERELQR